MKKSLLILEIQLAQFQGLSQTHRPNRFCCSVNFGGKYFFWVPCTLRFRDVFLGTSGSLERDYKQNAIFPCWERQIQEHSNHRRQRIIFYGVWVHQVESQRKNCHLLQARRKLGASEWILSLSSTENQVIWPGKDFSPGTYCLKYRNTRLRDSKWPKDLGEMRYPEPQEIHLKVWNLLWSPQVDVIFLLCSSGAPD